MQAGRLRYRLEVQRPVESRDDQGGVVQSWSTVHTVWGDLEPLRAKELLEAAKIEARLSHRLTLRHYPGLAPTWRLRLAGTTRVFQPYQVRDVHERRRLTEVLAMEIV
jgi:SPP1 family predicted phage head-tail adaptor